MRAWSARGFAKSAPNAALAIDGAPRGRDVLIVELRRPRWDARHATLTYDAVPLRGQGPSSLRAFARRGDRLRELRFGRASLFVDDGSSVTYLPLTLVVQGMPPGNTLALRLSGDGVQFSQGVGNRSQLQFTTEPQGFGTLEIAQLLLTSSQLILAVSPEAQQSDSYRFSGYLAVTGPVPRTISAQLMAPPSTALVTVVDGFQSQALLPGAISIPVGSD